MKHEPLYKFVQREKPNGVMTMCNTFGVAVWLNDPRGENCVAAWHNGTQYYNAHNHMIHYSYSGRPFIKKGNLRLYLDQFLRV